MPPSPVRVASDKPLPLVDVMTEFTRGAWLYEPNIGLVSGDGWTVCNIPTVERRDYLPRERDANGYLIASSKDLLSALEALFDLDCVSYCDYEIEKVEAATKARAVIARARGACGCPADTKKPPPRDSLQQ